MQQSTLSCSLSKARATRGPTTIKKLSRATTQHRYVVQASFFRSYSLSRSTLIIRRFLQSLHTARAVHMAIAQPPHNLTRLPLKTRHPPRVGTVTPRLETVVSLPCQTLPSMARPDPP